MLAVPGDARSGLCGRWNMESRLGGRAIAGDEPAVDEVANVACDGKRGLFWRSERAEVARLAILLDVRLVPVAVLKHALETRRIARRHQLEALSRRGSPGLGRGERLRPFDPRLCRLCRSSRRSNVPSVAQGRLLWRSKPAEIAQLAILTDPRQVLAFVLAHAF